MTNFWPLEKLYLFSLMGTPSALEKIIMGNGNGTTDDHYTPVAVVDIDGI